MLHIHNCNPSIREAEACVYLFKFQNYIERPCLRKGKKSEHSFPIFPTSLVSEVDQRLTPWVMALFFFLQVAQIIYFYKGREGNRKVSDGTFNIQGLGREALAYCVLDPWSSTGRKRKDFPGLFLPFVLFCYGLWRFCWEERTCSWVLSSISVASFRPGLCSCCLQLVHLLVSASQWIFKLCFRFV